VNSTQNEQASTSNDRLVVIGTRRVEVHGYVYELTLAAKIDRAVWAGYSEAMKREWKSKMLKQKTEELNNQFSAKQLMMDTFGEASA